MNEHGSEKTRIFSLGFRKRKDWPKEPASESKLRGGEKREEGGSVSFIMTLICNSEYETGYTEEREGEKLGKHHTRKRERQRGKKKNRHKD